MIYIHVPYCRSFCNYCGFYSEILPGGCASPAALEAWKESILDEISLRREEIAGTGSCNTLYFGGGTPSVLPLTVLREITEALGQASYDEFTLEVNPDDIVRKGMQYLEGLRSIGVNRISMGVQSLDDGMLRWMNRRHSASDAKKAFRMLREAGFGNISIDLIFGISHLSDELWASTIDQALDLAGDGTLPEHVSAYQLSIDPESALDAMVADGRYVEADENLCRRQYDMLCSRLSDAGYVHYEISNFALPGREAKHNSAYWEHRPYVGLGRGAHSFVYPDLRKWNNPDGSTGSERLDGEQIVLEKLMLGLRTARGLEASWMEAHIEKNLLEQMLREEILIKYILTTNSVTETFIRIPESMFFVSDSVILRLVGHLRAAF